MGKAGVCGRVPVEQTACAKALRQEGLRTAKEVKEGSCGQGGGVKREEGGAGPCRAAGVTLTSVIGHGQAGARVRQMRAVRAAGWGGAGMPLGQFRARPSLHTCLAPGRTFWKSSSNAP